MTERDRLRDEPASVARPEGLDIDGLLGMAYRIRILRFLGFTDSPNQKTCRTLRRAKRDAKRRNT